jgi:hypothetical protein
MTGKETLEVEVTQEDIDLADQGMPASCAIARAMNRIAGVSEAYVTGTEIRCQYRGKLMYCLRSHIVSTFISIFDSTHGRTKSKPTIITLAFNWNRN